MRGVVGSWLSAPWYEWTVPAAVAAVYVAWAASYLVRRW